MNATAISASPTRPRQPRWLVPWLIANVVWFLVVCVAAAAGSDGNPRLLYLLGLFALCSSSLLGSGPLNGRSAVLVAFSAVYFIFYGLADFARLFPTLELMKPSLAKGPISAPEVAVLVFIALILVGYRMTLRLAGKRGRPFAANEWSPSTAVMLGIVLWAAGAACTWYWATNVADRYITSAEITNLQGIALLIGRMMQPVGVALLAYRLVVSRSKPLLMLVIGVLAIEFVLGFLADSKELSIRGIMLVLAAKFLVEGRVPKSWLVAAGLVVATSFAVFQSYRFEVLQVRHQTRSAAADNLSKNLNRTLSSNMLQGGYLLNGLRGFVERTNMKPAIELIEARVGKDVEFRGGDTIAMVVGAFVPRFLWKDKPDAAVGQLFNRAFKLSLDRNTYVSVTHLGELFWNFGWLGILIGAPVIGVILGTFGGRFALSDHRSLTRFLIISTTLYLLAARFEGGIAMTYTVWIRSVLAILVLHLFFAWRSAPRAAPASTALARA